MPNANAYYENQRWIWIHLREILKYLCLICVDTNCYNKVYNYF